MTAIERVREWCDENKAERSANIYYCPRRLEVEAVCQLGDAGTIVSIACGNDIEAACEAALKKLEKLQETMQKLEQGGREQLLMAEMEKAKGGGIQ